MPASVLGHLVLGYQLVWDRNRRPRGVHLRVEATEGEAVDAALLLRMLADSWSGTAPQLILSTPEEWLLRAFLQHADAQSPWIAVHQAQLALPDMAPLVHAAHARGAQLLWRGESGAQTPLDTAGAFGLGMLTLTAGEALWSLRATRARQQGGGGAGGAASPVVAGQIYEAVPSLALARHCLDEQDAWGIAGWPVDDVLMRGDQQQALPDRAGLRALIATVDADASMDRIEQVMDTQPVVVYRFLLYLNSAALGLRNAADSLRHGLMMLGMRNLRDWLQQQMAVAGDDADLWPVRRPMVLRAQLTEALVNAGEEDALRREIYLCALLAEAPRMLGEPLHVVLGRLEIPERITSALVSGDGPYAPFLALSEALGSHALCHTVPALCQEHEMDLAEVNRVLLRTLAQQHARAPGVR